MELNADFSRRVVAHGARMPWVDSPMPGVRRRMLDRIGAETARATSIVSYEPHSRFSPHVHTGGEEFLVLEGVFEDEHGAYPKGSYVRNPPESRHTPGSTPGCVLLVKLWQFDLADRTPVRLETEAMTARPDAARPGVAVIPLWQDALENVRIETWAAGIETVVDTAGGAELFVLEGSFDEGPDHFESQSWLRVPIGGTASVRAGDHGARVWIKSGHLAFARAPQ